MAPASRTEGAPLIERLTRSPGSFEFHQAVRLVELEGLASGAGAPVGDDAPPEREAARFRVHPSLAFATSQIRACRVLENGRGSGTELDVTFAGLVGAAGVLPPHYSELVLAREAVRDRSLKDFLDVLHRRTVALMHRAWRKSHYPFAFELEALRAADHDSFTTALLSLSGLGGETFRRRQAVDDLSFAHSAGAFANQVRSAAGLAGTLTATFGVPFEVEQFVGAWLDVPEGERSTLLGRGEAPAERHALGTGFTLGSRVWDVQSRIRVVAGPLTLDEYAFFAEEAPGRARVMATARTYVGDAIDVELECVLAERESPGITLGARQRLGRDAWLEHAPKPAKRRTAGFALAAH